MKNKEKPAHLNQYSASAFQEQGVVEAYQHRAQYSSETFEVLRDLMPDRNGRALDVGCGTGFVARYLVRYVGQVDAIDISSRMIEQGKKLEYGKHPNLYWHVARAEEAAPQPPYALITAGESLHWMDWETVMPHFADLLESNGVLAMLSLVEEPCVWRQELGDIIAKYSTVQNFQPIDVPIEFERRGLFVRHGSKRTTSVEFRQTLESYVESFHGRASFSRERMTPKNSFDFDQAIRDLVTLHTPHEVVLNVASEIVWGTPVRPK
jgi:SAM-dependent methyltransferase